MIAFLKPSRLDRDVAKYQRRVLREKVRTSKQRAEDAAWQAISTKVKQRDGNCCRVCTCQTTRAGVGDPRCWGHAHHIVYRSAGGADLLSNLIWLCQSCHDQEHRHTLSIAGTSDDIEVTYL